MLVGANLEWTSLLWRMVRFNKDDVTGDPNDEVMQRRMKISMTRKKSKEVYHCYQVLHDSFISFWCDSWRCVINERHADYDHHMIIG